MLADRTIATASKPTELCWNDDWCKFFKENDFRRRLHRRTTGVPRRIPATSKAFPLLLQSDEGINLLKKYNVEYNAMAVVNDYNVDYPIDFYNFSKALTAVSSSSLPIVERIRQHADGTTLYAS